jgi:Xaa-Pro dipeptidase
LKLGIFQRKNDSASDDDNVKALVQSGLTSAFYPHGVGHLLGLDVHDAGGLPNGKSNDPLLKYLRLIGVPLEPGFVVTVEPGIYFNPHLFSRFSNSPLVNHEIHGRYQYVGGVRIEDNLLITEGGFQNLTNIAKTVQEVEALTAR